MCYVAEESDLATELDVKGKSDILKSIALRVKFLSEPTHPVVLHYTPKHASWLNQVEIGLSNLVWKVIKRDNFTSVKEVK